MSPERGRRKTKFIKMDSREEIMSYEGIENLLKALKEGSLLRKLRNENARLKRELKRLRKEYIKKPRT